LEVFGADRLVFGGDWPIYVLSGGYRRVCEGLSAIFDELDCEERHRFYGIDARTLGVTRSIQE